MSSKCGPNIHYHNSNAHLPKYPPNIVQQNIPQGEPIPYEKLSYTKTAMKSQHVPEISTNAEGKIEWD
jgi:hypothetical protein